MYGVTFVKVAELAERHDAREATWFIARTAAARYASLAMTVYGRDGSRQRSRARLGPANAACQIYSAAGR